MRSIVGLAAMIRVASDTLPSLSRGTLKSTLIITLSKHPLFFDSFYVSMLSQQHKTGKTQILKAIYIGLISNLKAIKKGNYSSSFFVFSKSDSFLM